MAKKQRRLTTLIRGYVTVLEARGIPVEQVLLFDAETSGTRLFE